MCQIHKIKYLYKVWNCRAADSACNSISAALLVQLGLAIFLDRKENCHMFYLANLW